MATKTVMWGDGTSDSITVTYSGAVGSSGMVVSSAPNRTLLQRRISVKLKINGATVGTLTVDQNAQNNAFSIAYSKAYN